MEQRSNDLNAPTAGSANMPPGNMRAGEGETETERELERTRDLAAEAAAPVVADKTQEAVEETARRLKDDPRMEEQVRRTAEAAKHDAQKLARDKVDEVKHRAEDKVDQGFRRAAGRLDEVADRVERAADRQTAGATGARARAGEAAHQAADRMHDAADYLRDTDFQELRGSLERQMRDNPLQTLLAGVAAGWVVGKILR